MYIGRFAPSPTGPLHFGSLVAALASWLDARRHGGRWLLRIEDLDPPREVPGAADAILRTLEAFGLSWDGPVLYQSSRLETYWAALDELRAAGHAYDCGCTRREIAEAGQPGLDGPVYPGTCRAGLPPGKAPRAVRLRTEAGEITFTDRMQGPIRQDVAREVGDFVIRRADGYFAYQLAVVVDDAFQGITHVVRGADLLDSTPRQILLQRLLGLPTPAYLHHRLVLTPEGEKLSKQTHAPAVDDTNPVPTLIRALEFLGEPVPRPADVRSPEEVLDHVMNSTGP
ncbi:tRNA glutamyl-Q(34) synthetase GluQRS [Thioalkalivibrio sulfidiphilus]|uniref:tRNA glutamyl-Q(34) synthetase GluQRS n=1 Tax=Thioalkalivibrio sulfidiphilus TaxID=1033854 RepID=UPI003B2AEB44